MRRLEDGELDLLLFLLPVRRTGVATAELFREPLWLALARDYPLSSRRQVEVSDLKGVTVLALESGDSLHGKIVALCRAHSAHPPLDFATTSLDTLRQMAAMGVGATFLPPLYVRAEAAQNLLPTVLPFAEPPPSRTIGLVWGVRPHPRVPGCECSRGHRPATTIAPDPAAPLRRYLFAPIGRLSTAAGDRFILSLARL